MKGDEKKAKISVWVKIACIAAVIKVLLACLAFADISLKDIKKTSSNFRNYIEANLREALEDIVEHPDADSSGWENGSSSNAAEIEAMRDVVDTLSERAAVLHASSRHWFIAMQRAKVDEKQHCERPLQVRMDLLYAIELDSRTARYFSTLSRDVEAGRINRREGRQLLRKLGQARNLNQGTISDLSMTIEAWPKDTCVPQTIPMPEPQTDSMESTMSSRRDTVTIGRWLLPPHVKRSFLDSNANGYEWSKHILPPLEEK